jgi:hypothetical protein
MTGELPRLRGFDGPGGSHQTYSKDVRIDDVAITILANPSPDGLFNVMLCPDINKNMIERGPEQSLNGTEVDERKFQMAQRLLRQLANDWKGIPIQIEKEGIPHAYLSKAVTSEAVQSIGDWLGSLEQTAYEGNSQSIKHVAASRVTSQPMELTIEGKISIASVLARTFDSASPDSRKSALDAISQIVTREFSRMNSSVKVR